MKKGSLSIEMIAIYILALGFLVVAIVLLVLYNKNLRDIVMSALAGIR